VTQRRLVLRLILRMPSPTALTFLAGLFAGAGINMLTSTATGESGGTTRAVALDAIAWVAAAAFLTTAAHQLEVAERDAALHIMNPNLSAAERRAERDRYFDKVAGVTASLIGLTMLSILAAVLLLPG
jgi:hypothetical protein